MGGAEGLIDRRPRQALPSSDDRAGASAVLGRGQRLALLALFALLAALRLPGAWRHGRFLGEEGTIFFAYAWHRPALDALGRSFGGYLNLSANATTLLAARLVQGGVLPLEKAPYLTMGIALLFQMLPAVLILTGRGRWLASRATVCAALLLFAIVPRTEEVFFNVLHIQFHLALAAALVLALDLPASRAARIGYAAILLLAPLCGPAAIILLLFFLLRALVDRHPVRWLQTLMLAIGAAAQLLSFFVRSPMRGHMIGPVDLASIMLVRLAALPLLGAKPAERIGTRLNAFHLDGSVGLWCAAALAVAYFGTLVVFAARRPRDPAVWLIVPGLAIAAVSFGGGMISVDSRQWFSPEAGERYTFLPLVLLTLGLIALARRFAGLGRRLCVALCMLTLISGASAYGKPVSVLRAGPAWNQEVALWRRDPDHALVTWPSTWTVDLSNHDRPCSPPRRGWISSPDPTYCESAWMAHVAQDLVKDDQLNR